MSGSTTRRIFLGGAAAAGAAALAPRSANAAIEPSPWGIKLGLATYTFRSFERSKSIEFIKELKTPWISIKPDVPSKAAPAVQHMPYEATPAELQAIHKEYTDAGLKIMSAGNVDMAKATTPEAMKKIFEWAKNAGIPMMVCAPTHANMPLVEAMVKEYDIRIAIHNHGPEDHNFPTPQSVLDVVRKLDKRCGLCMDVGHSERTGLNGAGIDVAKTIGEAGDRLFDMHVKDLTDFTSRDSQVDVGDGKIPFPAIFRQLHKMGYQGCVNLEYEINDKNPMPGVQRSFSYMRGVLAALASA
jgi:sugar phosphate isomerase/epimerase